METFRTIGIDLGITSAHTAVVVDPGGNPLARRQVRPTLESLSDLEQAALANSDSSTSLRIVLEPTGSAWLPVAVYFIRRGHTVFRVSSAKASDLRKFFKRHAKTNQIDALTLAKMPLIDPDCLLPLELAEGAAASLNRRVRACERLGRQIARHKTRIRELARQMMPALDEAMDRAFRDADRVVLEHYANPHRLAKVPVARLAARIHKETGRGSEYVTRKATAWVAVARAAVELYGEDPAVAFEDLADEIATEITMLKILSAELARHEAAREAAYLAVDERQLARSLPGVGIIGGPTLVAAMGRPGRFPRAASFRRFTGLTPRASETGESDAKGQVMSKAGANWLRDQLVQSANTARQVDPDLGRIYYTQMVERGAHHNKALCVVAGHLAERVWVTMLRQQPYVLRDLEGNAISVAEGKAIVAEHFSVPEEVRRRRRTKKNSGKAPHGVLLAQIGSASRGGDKRGDLPHSPVSAGSRASSRRALTTA
jgi:transposase